MLTMTHFCLHQIHFLNLFFMQRQQEQKDPQLFCYQPSVYSPLAANTVTTVIQALI